MKKIGPLFSIISGSLILLLGAFTLLAIKDIWRIGDVVGDFVNDYAHQKGTSEWIAISTMGFGAVTLILGIFAWRKPSGISAIILLLLFAITAGLNAYAGFKTDWQASTIITMSVSGIASIGLLMGVFSKG